MVQLLGGFEWTLPVVFGDVTVTLGELYAGCHYLGELIYALFLGVEVSLGWLAEGAVGTVEFDTVPVAHPTIVGLLVIFIVKLFGIVGISYDGTLPG